MKEFFSEKAKKILKPAVLASSLFLGNPENILGNEIQDNCKKIEKILKIQKNLDFEIQEDTSNLDYWKLKKYSEKTNDFCKNPIGVGIENDLISVGNELENFEFLEKEISKSENKEEKFLQEFFKVQKNFLGKYEKFLKNFGEENIFKGNLVYGVQEGDILFEIVGKVFNTKSGKEIEKIISKLKEIKKEKVITRKNQKNNKKSITQLSIGDKIDFGVLYDEGKLSLKKEISEELQEKYKMGFLSEMYVKGKNFPLLLDPNRMFNSQEGSFGAWCAAQMYEFEKLNFSEEFPSAYDGELFGQANAYDVLPQILKNGGELLDIGKSAIDLVQIGNLEDYGNSIFKKVKIKASNNQKSFDDFEGWKLEPKGDKPYLEFSKSFEIKEKKWTDYRKSSDRIMKIDGKWIGLEEKSDEFLKEKNNKIYEQAKENPGSFIFWHYTLTNEYPKIIFDQYNFYVYPEKFSEEEKKYPPSSFGSHYTYNFGVKKIDYSLRKIQELNQKGENLPKKEINENQKISIKDAISTIIPGWNDKRSDNFLDKEKIFKNVKIFLEKNGEISEENLYDIWIGESELNLDYEIGKDEIFSIEDIIIGDEYIAQGRIMPLSKLLCQIEKSGARFIPNEIVKTGENFRDPINPYFIEEIEKLNGVELAGIDSPKIFNVAEVDLKDIGKNIQKPFSVKGINEIFKFYNENFGKKEGFKIAKWNQKNGKTIEGQNLVFFRYNRTKDGGKLTFYNQEKNFDEIFERQVKEGIYKESDKDRVKYFLEKIGKSQAEEKGETFNHENFYTNLYQINTTQQIPIFKFTLDSSLSEKESLISNSERYKLKSLEEIQKIGKENGIKFLAELTEKDLEQAKKVTKDTFKQATLIGLKGYETGGSYHDNLIKNFVTNEIGINKNSFENLVYKIDNLFGLETVGSVGDFQINFNFGTEILRNFFIKDFNSIDKSLQNEFVEKIFYEINSEFGEYLKSEEFEKDRKIVEKNRKGEGSFKIPKVNKKIFTKEKIFKGTSKKYQDFEKKIEELILDEKNIGTDFLVSYLFLEEKERNIHTYARIFYGDEYYSVISQETDKIGYNDDLRIGMIDGYRGDLNSNIIRGQSYILNKLLFGEGNFGNEQIFGEINNNFLILVKEFLEKYENEIKNLGIKHTGNSILNSLLYKYNGKYHFSKDPLRILGGKEFKESMGNLSGENFFQIIKKVYKNKFGKNPPMFMGNEFKKDFYYLDEKGNKNTPRGVTIERIGKIIIEENK